MNIHIELTSPEVLNHPICQYVTPIAEVRTHAFPGKSSAAFWSGDPQVVAQACATLLKSQPPEKRMIKLNAIDQLITAQDIEQQFKDWTPRADYFGVRNPTDSDLITGTIFGSYPSANAVKRAELLIAPLRQLMDISGLLVFVDAENIISPKDESGKWNAILANVSHLYGTSDRLTLDRVGRMAMYMSLQSVIATLGFNPKNLICWNVSRGSKGWGKNSQDTLGIASVTKSHLCYTTDEPLETARMPSELALSVPAQSTVHLSSAVAVSTNQERLSIARKMGVSDVIIFPEDMDYVSGQASQSLMLQRLDAMMLIVQAISSRG